MMEWLLLGVLTYIAWVLHERNRRLAASIEQLMKAQDKLKLEQINLKTINDELTAVVVTNQTNIAELATRGTIPPSRINPLSK